MDRTEFLKFISLTPFAGLLSFKGDEIKPKSKEAESKLKDLHEAFEKRKPIKIAGVDFMLTEYTIDYGRGRKTIELTLIGYGSP